MRINRGNPGKNRLKGLLWTLVAVLILCVSSPGQISREPIQFPPPLRQQQSAKTDKVTLIKLRVEEGRVTADITDTPMQSVLREIAERTGIVFEVRSQDNRPISIHVNRIPLQDFIQRVTSGSNAIFLFGQGAEADRITLVRVYPRTAPIQQPSIVYLGTGVVTKTSNTVETPEQALQVVAGDASIEDRELAIEILVKTKGEAAVKALMNCISDPSPEIRIAAIEGLSAMGSRDALPEILKSLKDTHPGVRLSAVTAVGLLGSAANLKDVRPLSSDRDASVSAAAEMAIRRLSTTEKK
jgi:hypothetical protein